MEDKVEFNFGNNFVINNDQGLEEEELEDRRRRQEEIHNILTQAMGSCSLTDDSSINSSSQTAIGTTSDAPNVDLEKQYLESNVDDQLKLLYEIRTREVKDLNEKLEKLQLELQEQQKVSSTKIALVELENERKNISLQEARNLLVDKTEQIEELNKQVENMKYIVTCLEGNLAEVTDEKEIMRQLNLSLEQQMHLIEKNGFPLMNKSTDRELRESLNNRIEQLEHSLESALKKNEQQATQHTELVKSLRQTIQEKDNYLAEKGFLINKLTENFEVSQMQCQELLKTVTELQLTQQNEAVRAAKDSVVQLRPYEEEMRKVQENKERLEMCESVRQSVTEEFEVRLNSLDSENKILIEKLNLQEEQLANALKQTDIISIIESEKAILQENLTLLQEKLQFTLNENKKYQEKLTAQLQKTNISLQTSFIVPDPIELESFKQGNTKMLGELEMAQQYILELETKLAQLEDEYSHLKAKAELEQKRDELITALQAKAANFEKSIAEQQKIYLKHQSEKTSIGVNTEQYLDTENSLLKLKYDALLYQRESDLRNELQKEFEAKRQTFETNLKVQLSQSASCKECEKLDDEIRKFVNEKKEDREAVKTLVEVWQNKLQKEGLSFDEKFKQYISALDEEFSGRFKVLAHRLQEQFLNEIKHQERKVSEIHSNINNRVAERINIILANIQQGNIEVNQIEQKHKGKADKKRKNKK